MSSVTLGFFDDIYIPAENLQNTSRFDEAEHVWIWEYETEESKHDLFMDTGLFQFRISLHTKQLFPSYPQERKYVLKW